MNALVPTEIDVLTLPSLPFERRNDLPNIAAIYFVLSGNGDMLYIGRTKKLCFRFLSHHRLGDFKHTAQVCVAYLSVTDVTLLPSIEKAMIAYFDPPLNRQGSGSACGATIHLKTTHELRNRVLGKLRTRGTTIQSFFVDMMELIDSDVEFLEMLEAKRNGLRRQRELVSS